MLRTFLLIAIVATAISVIGATSYISVLDKQIAIQEKRLRKTTDSAAYYRYEFKHSTSGTRRHVGKALYKVVVNMHYYEDLKPKQQKELQDLQDERRQFAEKYRYAIW